MSETTIREPFKVSDHQILGFDRQSMSVHENQIILLQYNGKFEN